MIFKFITLLLVLHFTQQQQTDSNSTNTSAQNSTQAQNNTESSTAAQNSSDSSQNANITAAQIRMLSENYGSEDYRIVKDACRKQCQLKKKIQQIDWVWTQYNPMNPYIYKDAPKKDKQYLTKLFMEMMNSKGVKQEVQKPYENTQYQQHPGYQQKEKPSYQNEYPSYQEPSYEQNGYPSYKQNEYQQNEYPSYQEPSYEQQPTYQQNPQYQQNPSYQQNDYGTYQQQQYYDKN